MKYGLNEEEVSPNELPGLRQGPPGEGAGRRAQPLRRKKGVRAMPGVCQASLSWLWLHLAPAAPVAPGLPPGHCRAKGEQKQDGKLQSHLQYFGYFGRPSCFFFFVCSCSTSYRRVLRYKSPDYNTLRGPVPDPPLRIVNKGQGAAEALCCGGLARAGVVPARQKKGLPLVCLLLVSRLSSKPARGGSDIWMSSYGDYFGARGELWCPGSVVCSGIVLVWGWGASEGYGGTDGRRALQTADAVAAVASGGSGLGGGRAPR
ncbi:unnamed protein product [Arctogadus glacialis]